MRIDLAAAAAQYASAIIDLATDSGADKTVLEDLKSVNQVVSQSSELEIILRHPAVNSHDKKQLVTIQQIPERHPRPHASRPSPVNGRAPLAGAIPNHCA